MELARLPVQRIAQRLVEGIDSTLLVIILSLSMLGFAALFSASYDTPGRVLNQFVSLCIALTAMWMVAQLAPQTLMRFAVPAYVIGFAFLGLFEYSGPLQTGLRGWWGPGARLPELRSLGGVALMMTLVFYPYVYLLARVAFREQGTAVVETARSLGLGTFLPDERTDPEKSAHAAARYLKTLHGRFGNWPLAFAAYNAGEGRVSRALTANRAHDFAGIARTLPSETRMYVPKVCALIAVRAGVPPDRLERLRRLGGLVDATPPSTPPAH